MDSHLEHIRICMGEPDSTPHITINADIHPEEAKEAMRQWMEDDRITIKENKRSSDNTITRIEKDLYEYDKMIMYEVSIETIRNVKRLIIDRESVLIEFIPDKTDSNFERYEKAIAKCNRLKEKTDCKSDELKNQHPQSTLKTFETKLDDNGRIELCCKLVSEAEAEEIPTYKKAFIGEVDRPTLIYLLGGERPLKIKKIQMGGSHQNVYAMLLKISKHKNKKGKECLPDFLTKASGNICSQVLLDKDGKEITKLNNNTDHEPK